MCRSLLSSYVRALLDSRFMPIQDISPINLVPFIQPICHHWPHSQHLSTLPPPLCSSEPFNIIVTARILSTPHPDKFITIVTR